MFRVGSGDYVAEPGGARGRDVHQSDSLQCNKSRSGDASGLLRVCANMMIWHNGTNRPAAGGQREEEAMIAYENRLDQDRRWALREGSMHFEKESSVYKSLLKIAKRLDTLSVPYALVGGMAMFLHGYRRFTEDVDILVTRESLKTIHERLEGLGYLPPFTGSKNLRDTEHGVRIEFLIAGGYPGDGLPKPVSFPDPETVATELDGVRVVKLPTLIELKLASGTAPGRRKDLGDVQELIRFLQLPESLVDQLDPSVRASYLELWRELKAASPEE